MKFSSPRSRCHLYPGNRKIEQFAVGDTVRVIDQPTWPAVTITRIDTHVYPICAGGVRYKPIQLELVAARPSKKKILEGCF